MCIIVCNHYEDIEAAIASVEKFTFTALTWKLYIVDNGTALSSIFEVNTFKQKIETMMDVQYIDTIDYLGFGRGNNQAIGILDSEYHAGYGFSKLFQVPFGQGFFLVISTELLKQLGGFDDRYFMLVKDADLCKRVNQVSKMMYYPDARVIHKWEKGAHRSKVLFN